MAGPLRVEPDVEVGRWLQQVLRDDWTTAVLVPPVFEAYARILHPAELQTPTGETDAWGMPAHASREITWAESAPLLGEREVSGDRYTAWEARFGGRDTDLPGRCQILPPHGGDTPLPLLATLAELLLDEHGDGEVLAAVWEGSGLDPRGSSVFAAFPEGTRWWARRRETRRLQAEHRAEQVASVDPEVLELVLQQRGLGLPREGQGRGHVLLRTQLTTFADARWVETAGLGWRADRPGQGRTPNAIWPAEPHGAPAWFIATDMDLDITHVGGSAHLIGRILGHPAIEAERIRPTDPLV